MVYPSMWLGRAFKLSEFISFQINKNKSKKGDHGFIIDGTN